MRRSRGEEDRPNGLGNPLDQIRSGLAAHEIVASRDITGREVLLVHQNISGCGLLRMSLHSAREQELIQPWPAYAFRVGDLRDAP
jgi:hypothetical protein